MADLEKDPSFSNSASRTTINPSPKFAGVAYPLPKNGSIGFVVDEHAINASLRQLMMTEPGERLFEPEFGTPLRRMLFQQQDALLYSEIARLIGASIQRWEPRIVVVSPNAATTRGGGTAIRVGAAYDSQNEPVDHAVMVSVHWSFKDNLKDVFLFEAPISRTLPGARLSAIDS